MIFPEGQAGEGERKPREDDSSSRGGHGGGTFLKVVDDDHHHLYHYYGYHHDHPFMSLSYYGDDNRKNLDEMETEQVGPSTKSFTPFVGVGNHHHHLPSLSPSPSPSPLLN